MQASRQLAALTMRKEENLESPLLSDGEPAPADSEGGSGYALVCALLASLTSIIFGYSKLAPPAGFFFFLVVGMEMAAHHHHVGLQRVADLSPEFARTAWMQTAA